MQQESLKMRFNGDDEIDLQTLTNSLNSTLDCLKIIANNVISKNDYCKFVVKNVEKGSFIIDISVIKEIAETFIPISAGIVTIFTGIYQIRKHLKGKAPKEIKNKSDGNTTIVNVDGNSNEVKTNIVNLYINEPDIERQLAQLSEVLSKDDGRTSLVLEENNSGKIEKVEYNKEDLINTSTAIDIASFDSSIEETINNVWIKIKKLYFQGEAKWDFILQIGNQSTISATIEDEDFLTKIRTGNISVTSETKLFVELKVQTKTDKDGKNIGKPQYFITKVINHKEPPTQMSIDDIEKNNNI